MKRLLIQRQHARAAQSAAEKDDEKPHSLWKGVHIEITPFDLQEQVSLSFVCVCVCDCVCV